MDADIFKAIFDNMNDAIIFLDMEGRVRHANPAAYNYIKPGTELIEKLISARNKLDNATSREFIDFFSMTKRAGKGEKEMEIRFLNGDVEWVKLTSKIISGSGSAPQGVVINISNISKLKKYADAIRESQKNYKMVVGNLHEGLCLVDSHENILYGNPALGRMLGYTSNELMEMNISDLVPQEEFNLIRKMTMDRRKGRTGEYLTKMITKKKEIKRVKISAAPRFDSKGNYIGSIGLIMDLTDAIKQNFALKDSEEKYRATVEQSADNIYIYDIESRTITESNKALQELLGYGKEEMIGMKASDFVIHGEENIDMKVKEVLNKGKSIIGERKYRKKSGGLVDVDVSATLITQGRRKKLCVVSRDITEKKKFQQQLITERKRAEFYLDLLAHDLGNMLHGIRNGLELFMIINEKQKKEEVIEMVISLAERSIRLSKDIQTFSMVKDDALKPTGINLKKILLDSYRKACDSISVSDSDLDIEIEDDLTVIAEPIIEEAFFNLFHNSLKIQKGGDIYIGVRANRSDRKIKINIMDHGGGISDDMKPLLFERFHEDRIRKMSGIGMTIVRMVIERYDGNISLEDIMEDGSVKGTRFSIELPDKSLLK